MVNEIKEMTDDRLLEIEADHRECTRFGWSCISLCDTDELIDEVRRLHRENQDLKAALSEVAGTLEWLWARRDPALEPMSGFDAFRVGLALARARGQNPYKKTGDVSHAVRLVCWKCGMTLVACSCHEDQQVERSPLHWCDDCYGQDGQEPHKNPTSSVE